MFPDLIKYSDGIESQDVNVSELASDIHLMKSY